MRGYKQSDKGREAKSACATEQKRERWGEEVETVVFTATLPADFVRAVRKHAKAVRRPFGWVIMDLIDRRRLEAIK